MHFHQIRKCTNVKAHGFKLCCCFLLPVGVCIDVNFILSTIGSFVSRVSNHYTFATVYKGSQFH